MAKSLIGKNQEIIFKIMLDKENSGDIHNKRACWNSWIAPHNVEGFYMNMGDMLVKKGDWEKAIEIYQLAKDVPQYDTWDFKETLEKRIVNAEKNVNNFHEKLNGAEKNELDNVMLVNSSISCMSCHKMSEEDKLIYKDFDWDKYKEEFNIYGLN